MAHVFISYAHADFEFAENLKHRLEKADIDVWMDENIPPGRKWRDEIDEKLHESFAVVVIITPESVKSPSVTYEWIFALGVNIEVVPIYLQPIDEFPYRLSEIQYIDFRSRHRPWKELINRLLMIHGEQTKRVEIPEHLPLDTKRVISKLNSKASEERISAIKRLADFEDPETTLILLGMLKDENVEVRESAAVALLDRNLEPIVPDLVELLNQAEADIRRLAAWILGEAKDQRALAPLLQASKDKSPIVRGHVAGALGNYRTSDAQQRLEEMLSDKGKYRSRKGDPFSISMLAHGALFNISTPEAFLAAIERWQREQAGRSNS